MEKLNPCECGGEAKLILECYGPTIIFYGVKCSKCQKTQTLVPDPKKAIREWNRRNARNE